jgi:hypothetical protein
VKLSNNMVASGCPHSNKRKKNSLLASIRYREILENAKEKVSTQRYNNPSLLKRF